ncbi:MAG: fluoride efflux transporter CrcB [Halobacteriales archaeon]|nr:fluoride efflux transporter CrcB [Halobacteriales archaeon]
MAALDPGLLVGTGGVVGAVLRYAVSLRLDHEEFPTGTLAVNVLGSFVLGLVTFAGAETDVLLFVGTGACGAFTTFSSFSFETVRLWEDGSRGRAGLNAVGTLAAALIAIAIAWGLVQVAG